MKRIILGCAAVAIALASCNQEQLDRQQKTIDSLFEQTALKDSSMSLIATTLADVQTNLNYIKEKEGIIAVQANTEGSDKDQLKNDIQAIYARLVDNKNKVSELQRKLNKALGQNKENAKIIEVLQAQIEQQNAEIAKLNDMLQQKDVEIGYLNNAIINITNTVDSLTTVNTNTQSKLDDTTAELNSVFYLVAEKNTLKAKGLIEGGLFNKKVMSGNVDETLFTKVDKTTTEIIPLSGKKFKVLTSHPESSYTIAEENKVLVIKSKEAFWKTSKYLIVQARSVDEE